MTADLAWQTVVLCFLIGVLVGVVYFGGLWWTVNRLRITQSVARLLAVSWIIRNALFIGVFYWVMQGNWKRLVVAFLGMMSVRVVMTVYMKYKNKKEKPEKAA